VCPLRLGGRGEGADGGVGGCAGFDVGERYDLMQVVHVRVGGGGGVWGGTAKDCVL